MLSLTAKLNLVASAIINAPGELEPGDSVSYYYPFCGKLTKATIFPSPHIKANLIVEVDWDQGRAFVEGCYVPSTRSIIATPVCEAKRRAADVLNFKAETLPGAGLQYPQVSASSPIRILKTRDSAHA